jgi:hypothetical protein
MDILQKLGMTPEEFLSSFQEYLCDVGTKEKSRDLDLLVPKSTIVASGDSIVFSSHYKNFIELMICKVRDSKINNIIEGL